MNLERLWQGAEKTHSILWYGPLSNSGREDGDLQPYENNAFWANVRKHAVGHRDVIQTFGRFPKRNERLNRKSTEEELDYIKTTEGVY